MKRMLLFVLALLAVFSLPACIPIEFSGSRIGNGSQLVMEYSVLNKTEHQLLTLEAGDILDVGLVSESGTIDVTVGIDHEPAIYQERDVQTTSFELAIPESGIYRVSVTGKRAKGRVSFVKR